MPNVPDILLALLLIFLRWYAVLLLFLPLTSCLNQVALLGLCAGLGAVSLDFIPQEVLCGISETSLAGLLSLAAHEALCGIIIAAPLRLALSALPLSGRLIDTLRGAQFAEQVFIDLGEAQSLLESAANLLIPVILFSFGALHLLILALLNSLTAPALGFGKPLLELLPALVAHTEPLLLCANQSFKAALFAAAPVLGCCLLLDLGACLLSRVLGRINMLFELMPLRMLLALCVLAAGVPSFSWHAVEYLRAVSDYTLELARSGFTEAI